jgi:hypothetical protein
MTLPFLSSLQNALRPNLESLCSNTKSGYSFIIDLPVSIGDIRLYADQPLKM